MRRLSLLLAIVALALTVPAATLAAPWPAASGPACTRAGGTFSLNDSVDPIVKSCVVSLGGGGVSYWYGGSTGYVVTVTQSDDVNWYYMSAGVKTGPVFLGGAIAVTFCTAFGYPVPLTDYNCVPVSPYP